MRISRVDFCKLAALGLTCAATTPALADVGTQSTSYTFYGTPGLISMPTAEVAADSELAFTYSQYGPNASGTLTFQITPRLSGSFRYTKIADFHPRVGDYFDRSFDLRYRVLDETKYLPAVSVGIRDFIGTGIYAGEYIVATKSIGDRLRVTGGLGWGRLGSYEPIGSIGGTRPAWDFGKGGTLNASQWFKGDFAPFAGVSYKINDKLTVKAEYSSDAFVQEVAAGVMSHKSPFNFGVDYQVSPAFHLNAFYLAGDTIGASLTIRLNPRQPQSRSGNERAPLPVKPRPARGNAAAWSTDWIADPSNETGIRKAVSDALSKEGIALEGMALGTTRAELKVENNRYNSQAQAVGRTARVLTHAMPPSVETFVITLVENGIPLSTITMRRSDIERLEHAPSTDMFKRVTIDEATPRAVRNSELINTENRFRWALAPYMAVSFFDPQSPIRGEVGLKLSAQYELAPNIVLSGAISKSIWGNLDDATYTNTSKLPPVRTQSALYAAQGDPAIDHLTAAWYGRPAENLYSRVTVGYLEKMYGGVSGEVLWKPVDSPLAIGAELNWVKKRDYDQLFSFRDYSIVTGHVSAYYDFGNGFSTRVDAGRYLAGDYGATLAVDRTFANGWKVGGYVTKTNVSAEDFGEGSFDKGIRISLPLEWALGVPSRNSSDATIRSLARDGGARLNVDGRLFEWVEDGHGDALSSRWGKFWR
ncbi:YjbH domain-containing protein [uncultured Aliiroseovarius sp.]|uniref:YjbH domain-containing protein n=1 Tax=uncultured Aliiroseovarius sp. TaxID=1658783 RepID=UPI002627C3A6|nr:YjbH domain-containing protein [uncultured Aliiroseovarius sp.]